MPKVKSMPATAYNRTIYTIRDYPRLEREYAQLKTNIGVKAVTYNGMPRGTAVESIVELHAIRLADLDREITQMQELIHTIPADMREGILNNIYYNQTFPRNEWGQMIPSLRTWQREKTKFITLAARKLKII